MRRSNLTPIQRSINLTHEHAFPRDQNCKLSSKFLIFRLTFTAIIQIKGTANGVNQIGETATPQVKEQIGKS